MARDGLPLRDGERLIFSVRANRAQSNRAVGGRLYATNRRIVFAPHGVDLTAGLAPWELDVASLREISIAPRGRNPFDGSLRRRLEIKSNRGADVFVVPKVGRVAERLDEIRREGHT